VYSAREFTELLLAQPVGRRSLFAGLYLGLALPLAGAFLLGVGLPFAIHAKAEAALWGPLGMLFAGGLLLTFVFTAVAMLLAILFDDRAKGLGSAILIWLGCAVLYDGVILLLITMFREYPLERPVLVLTLLNPIDLGRVLLLLQFDTAALMGHGRSSRSSRDTLGRVTAALAVQATVPLLASRVFRRKTLAPERLHPRQGGRGKRSGREEFRHSPRHDHGVGRTDAPPHPRQQHSDIEQQPGGPHRCRRSAFRQARILWQDPPGHAHRQLHHPPDQDRLRMHVEEPEHRGGYGRGLRGEEEGAHRDARGEPAEGGAHQQHAEEGHPISPSRGARR
jgi:Cu-processing system permease protein